MKRCKIIILFVISAFISQVKAQDCSPNLKEIYNFEVGDIFQYKTFLHDESLNDLIHMHKYGITRKTILEKSINYDTIQYVIENKVFTYYDPITPPPDNREYYEPSKRTYTDTLVIIDSINHYLNACDSDIAHLYIEEWNDIIDIYLRTYINEDDSIKEKVFGGDYIFYGYNSNDSLVELPDGLYFSDYKSTYAEGLGQISLDEGEWESSSGYYLVGYVKNGDTTGIVWSDSDFPVSIDNYSNDQQLEVFPSIIPDNNIISIVSDKDYIKLRILSILGRNYEYKDLGNNQIQIKNLSKGAYFIIFYFDDYTLSRKIIKE